MNSVLAVSIIICCTPLVALDNTDIYNATNVHSTFLHNKDSVNELNDRLDQVQKRKKIKNKIKSGELEKCIHYSLGVR